VSLRAGTLIALRIAVALAFAAPVGLCASERPGGTLTYILGVQPATLVAFTTDGVRQISPKVTEGLLTYDFDLNPRPALAVEWAISKDGLTYTFGLRRGVKWHDGRDFTSADVAFSLRLLKEIHPRGRITFAAIDRIDTPDEYTAVVRLSQPAPFLISALAAQESPIVPRHIYEGTKAESNPANAAPVGTGPFRFKEWVRGSHIILERNPDYWDTGKPFIDAIVFRFIPDSGARAILFETGEADIADGNLIPLAELGRIEALPFLQLETRGTVFNAGVKRLEFNLDNPYLRHLKVRQAIAHAIDKKVIRDVIWYGRGEIVSGPISPELKRFYLTEGTAIHDFDPAKAERLLEEAGFPRRARGIRFKLPHDFRPSTDGDKRTAEYVKQALARIGIEVEVRTQDFASYVRRVYTDRDFAFTTNSMTNTFDPTVGIQRLYWSKAFKPGVPFSNGAHYANPEIDRLLEAAAIENDAEVRADLFARVQRIIAADLPDLNLISDSNFSIINRRVVDAVVEASGTWGSLADAKLRPKP
jgi:peptide/nickel transport system substrate-binding protein